MLKPGQYEMLAPCVPSTGAIILSPAITPLVTAEPLLREPRTGFIHLGSVKEQNYNNLRIFLEMPSLFYLFSVCLGWGNEHRLQLVGGQRTICLVESVFSFHHMGSGDGTLVHRPDCKSLYQLGHLAGPNLEMLTGLIFSSRTQKHPGP